jgi:hypothetical protein
MLNLGIINHSVDLIQYTTAYTNLPVPTNMSTHLPPGSILLRSQLAQSPVTGGSSQANTGSNGRPTASYNDFIRDIYSGIKSINNSINQITNSVIRMEQRLDTLETGLATVTQHLTEISEHQHAQTDTGSKQSVSAESMLLTRLDLMDVGCLLEPQLTDKSAQGDCKQSPTRQGDCLQSPTNPHGTPLIRDPVPTVPTK